MAKWILLVETNCNDTSREDEFNDWYDNIHIPDVLEGSPLMKATRFETAEPPEGKGQFIATYEVETDDILQVMKEFRERIAEKTKEGRMTILSKGYRGIPINS